MKFKKINVSKKNMGIFGLVTLVTTVFGFSLKKKSKKKPKGPNYAAGL